MAGSDTRQFGVGSLSVASRGKPRPRLGRLVFAIARGKVCGQAIDQLPRRGGDLFDGGFKRRCIGVTGMLITADLAHKLQRCGANFLVRGRRVEVEERANAAAHG